MANIEFAKVIAPTINTTLYGHQSLDSSGFPKDSGNFKLSDIISLVNADIDSEITTSFEFIDKGNSEYALTYKGTEVASLTLPPDRFLKSVSFDTDTKTLTLVFQTGFTTTSVDIDMSSLVDVYSAGKGLVLNGSTFSIKLVNSETRLKLTAAGLLLDLTDITDLISNEASTRSSAVTALDARITTIEENNDADITVLQSYKDDAEKAKIAAENARDIANQAKVDAQNASNEASNSASRASTAQGEAETASSSSQEYANSSKAYAELAEGYKNSAKDYSDSASLAKDAALEAKEDIENVKIEVEDALSKITITIPATSDTATYGVL